MLHKEQELADAQPPSLRVKGFSEKQKDRQRETAKIRSLRDQIAQLVHSIRDSRIHVFRWPPIS